MSKKAVLATLVVFASAGYGVYANWDSISDRLGLKELSPDRARAIRLAMDAYNLDNYRTNEEVIENRMVTSTGKIERGTWEAEPQANGDYLASFRFREDGEVHGYFFSVDFASREVTEVKRMVTESDVAPGIPR